METGRRDPARVGAVHARRAPPRPRGRLQPLVRARPLLRRLHGRAVALRRPPLGGHPRREGAAVRAAEPDLFGDRLPGHLPGALLRDRGQARRALRLGPRPGQLAPRQRPHVRRPRPHPHAALPLRLGRRARRRRRAARAGPRPPVLGAGRCSSIERADGVDWRDLEPWFADAPRRHAGASARPCCSARSRCRRARR